MKNIDYVRSVDADALAVLCEDGCPPGCTCPDFVDEIGLRSSCIRCWKEWLSDEYSPETERALSERVVLYKTPDFTNHTGQFDFPN